MKRLLQIVALFIALAVAGLWVAHGAHMGWTKTEAEIKTNDPVTGIDGITYEKKFQPGVDFLGAGLIAAVVLAGVSFLFRTNPKQPTVNNLQT
jgi:hypothetical protein